MPNVRHEESLDEIAIPECVQIAPLPNLQELEEDVSQKSDSLPSHSQYREDRRK
jgi:hypothetical protein